MSRWPRVTIAFEFQKSSMTELGFTPTALLDFVRSRGFRLFDFPRGRIRPLAADFAAGLASEDYIDILASRGTLPMPPPASVFRLTAR